MTDIVYALYDGNVFIPEGYIDILPNERYLIRIELKQDSMPIRQKNVLKRISERAKDLGISDLAEQHDHYLYGTKKI